MNEGIQQLIENFCECHQDHLLQQYLEEDNPSELFADDINSRLSNLAEGVFAMLEKYQEEVSIFHFF